MKIKLSKIIDSVAAFRQLNELHFMPRTSMDLYHLSKFIDTQLQAFDDAKRKIYEHYEEVEDKTQQTEELNALINTEIEIDVKQIPFTTIERMNIPIPTQMLLALDWIIPVPDGTEEEEVPVVKDIELK